MKIRTQFIALGRKANSNIHEDNVGVDRIAIYLKNIGLFAKMSYFYIDEGIDNIVNNVDRSCNYFGITLHSENVDFVFQLAEELKRNISNSVVFVGSIFATLCAKDIVENCEFIDFVVLGHGEIPIETLYQDIINNNLSLEQALEKSSYILYRNNMSKVKPCYSNIEIHSLPERQYLANNNKTVACIIGSHGCYGKCTFCTVPEPGAIVSERSANDIFDEIKKLYLSNKISFFYFLDAAIEGFGRRGKKRLLELCKLIINSNYKLSFRAFIRSESFGENDEDLEILKYLRKAGFVNLIIGIESGNENDLKIYNKLCTLADNKKCLSLFKNMNFNIMLGYIILNPYTNYYDLKQNYELLRNSEFSLLHNFINCLQVNYNTPIYYKLKEDGLLNDNFSFKTDGYDYHCIDDRTDKIFRFIKDNFLDSEICNKDFQFHNHLTHIFYLLNVLDGMEDIECEVKEIRKSINLLCKEYFKILIKDYELIKAGKKTNAFITNILALYKKVENIDNKLIKKYLLIK